MKNDCEKGIKYTRIEKSIKKHFFIAHGCFFSIMILIIGLIAGFSNNVYDTIGASLISAILFFVGITSLYLGNSEREELKKYDKKR